jgi:hypothetical protein
MASRPLKPGDPRRLGDYRLIARLGSGGMGTVFLGRDPDGRPVAVKAIRPEYADNEQFRARFRSEVERARQVPSFCTAAVLDADPDNDTPYLVVEYVDGPSLQEVVEERGPMSAGDLHSVAVGVAAALTAIHGAGVIHRDLKPLNVLLSLGLPKVIDFGIARALEVTSQHTRTGHYVGTVDYMAPERLDPSVGAVTAAADIFAWGATISFAGTGRIPFYGDTPMATAAQILTKEPDLRGLPASLTDLVARSLVKDPRGRPTANEIVQQLLAAGSPASELPAERAKRRATGRFDPRELLEQVIAEGPQRAAAPAAALPPGPPPARRRGVGRRSAKPATGGRTRQLIYAVGVLLVGSVTAATVAYARTDSTEDPAIDLRTAEAPAAITKDAPRGPSFFDPLRSPGRFRESVADYGRCTFHDDRLHARVNGRSTFQCPGPDEKFTGDQSITIGIDLANPDSCAMVWFRYQGDRGYQLTACADQVELEELDGVILTSIGRTPSEALRPGTPHKVSIAIAGAHATITVDGAATLQGTVSNPGLASGRIQLGVTNTSPGSTAEVSFADLEVRAG